ncbi:MAG: Bug family tripartite tricarboxylate transporter substrate binding protein [Burkholderiales bacterium]
MKTSLLVGAVAIILQAASGIAHGQAYPAKTVRVIVPNAAGGPSDLVGRILAQKLAEVWGHAVVVENRVGAGGAIGVDAVAKASPDGYTLLVTNSAPIVVNQSLYATIPYDPLTDLAPITLLASAPQVLIVPAASQANSVADLLRIARAEPGKLTFASLGNGTAPHLAGEMFKSQARLDLLHVPYRAVPQVHAALMVNEISMFFDVPTVLAQVKAGKMKALAVTGRARTTLAPDIPTLAESGLPEYEMGSWYGLMAPAAIARDIRAKVHADALTVLGQADVKAKMIGIGFEVVGNTPEQFAQHIQSESARWAKLIQASGLRAN